MRTSSTARVVDMHGESICLRDFFQQLKVTDDQVRLGDDAKFKPAMTRELFQNCACDFIAAFGRLVGIGCGLRLSRLDTALAGVQPTALASSVIGRFRYSRFNDDYRQIHQLCRLFWREVRSANSWEFATRELFCWT